MCVFKCSWSNKRWRERGGDGVAGRKEGRELTVAVFVLQGRERGDVEWEQFFSSPSVRTCVFVFIVAVMGQRTLSLFQCERQTGARWVMCPSSLTHKRVRGRG